MEGFEPSAGGFGDRCSTRLSYTPALLIRLASPIEEGQSHSPPTHSVRYATHGGNPFRLNPRRQSSGELPDKSKALPFRKGYTGGRRLLDRRSQQPHTVNDHTGTVCW